MQMSPSHRAASRQRLQLVAMNPTVLSIFGFYSIPIRSGNNDHNFGAGVQRFQTRGGVKGSGLQLRARSLNYPFGLASEFLYVLFQSFDGGLSGGKGQSFILFALSFERLSS